MGDTLGAVAALLPGVRIERPGRSAVGAVRGAAGARCRAGAGPGRGC